MARGLKEHKGRKEKTKQEKLNMHSRQAENMFTWTQSSGLLGAPGPATCRVRTDTYDDSGTARGLLTRDRPPAGSWRQSATCSHAAALGSCLDGGVKE